MNIETADHMIVSAEESSLPRFVFKSFVFTKQFQNS